MVWRLLGMIGAPVLAVALGYVWVTDAWTIRGLRSDISTLEAEKATLTARKDRLEKAIFDPVNGWSIRLKFAEANTKGLRGAIEERNAKIDQLERERQERNRARDAELVRLADERDLAEQRYTAIRNQVPQADIARQALDIVFGAIQ